MSKFDAAHRCAGFEVRRLTSRAQQDLVASVGGAAGAGQGGSEIEMRLGKVNWLQGEGGLEFGYGGISLAGFKIEGP